MPTLLRPHRRELSAPRANPLYGYGYNPAWPSILSVAHDEANGGRLFVITDRPCAIVSQAPGALPLAVAGLDVLEAEAVLSVKFRLWMSGPVPAGAAWSWAGAGVGLIDPITGHALNPTAGDCADVPGPYAPLPPAAVVSSAVGGTTVTLTFDRPVTLTGDPADDAVTFNGLTPSGVSSADAFTLSFALPGFVMSGDPWAIVRQPAWLTTPVIWPASGTL